LEFPGDISQEQICIGIVDAAIQKFGRIDVLVNNAASSGPEKKSSEITSEEWDEVLHLNLKGVLCAAAKL
jgi:NAD(P)-dependent dehydrogenase (short-subunit alcohol dehydrogenase family)